MGTRTERKSGQATLKFFSNEKNFGFVRLESGEEAFLPTDEMCHNGHITKDTAFNVSIRSTPRGWKVERLVCPGCSKDPVEVLRSCYGETVKIQVGDQTLEWVWNEGAETQLETEPDADGGLYSSHLLRQLQFEASEFLRNLSAVRKLIRRMGFYILLLDELRRIWEEALQQMPELDWADVEQRKIEVGVQHKKLSDEFKGRLPPTEMVIKTQLAYRTNSINSGECEVYEGVSVRADGLPWSAMATPEELVEYHRLGSVWSDLTYLPAMWAEREDLLAEYKKISISRATTHYRLTHDWWKIQINQSDKGFVIMTDPSPTMSLTAPTAAEVTEFLLLAKTMAKKELNRYLAYVKTYEEVSR